LTRVDFPMPPGPSMLMKRPVTPHPRWCWCGRAAAA
jgi:hypothetical protein